MTGLVGRRIVALAVAVALAALAAGCAPTVVVRSPSAPAGPSVSPAGSGQPSSPAQAGDCPITTEAGALPSDRLVSVDVSSGAGFDRIVFGFAERSAAPTDPRGTLRAATPPFIEDGRGEPVAVDGRRFVELRFDGMLLADEDGRAVYEGERELRPGLPAVEHAVSTGAFEGVITWIVGLNGSGCVTLTSDQVARTVTVDVAHG